MADLYVAEDYVIVGYVVGETATDIFKAYITLTVVDNGDDFSYVFNVLDQNTDTAAELTAEMEILTSDGKKFTIPDSTSSVSFNVKKTSIISKIDFETSESIIDIDATSVVFNGVNIELIETTEGVFQFKTIQMDASIGENAKITLNTGENIYIASTEKKKSIRMDLTDKVAINKIISTDANTNETKVINAPTTVKETFVMQTTTTDIEPKSIYHSRYGTEAVEEMAVGVGSLVFDKSVSETGKVYYEIDEDVLTINKLKSFKNVKDKFNLRDLRS